MGKPRVILFGADDDWSNFSAHVIEKNDTLYYTCEHLYQSEKLKFGHHKDLVRKARSPERAKKLADKFIAEDWYNKVDDWDIKKVACMEAILRLKLKQFPELKYRLVETGTLRLVEDSDHPFWGRGPDPNRKGKNMLGKLWMKLRRELVQRPGRL